MITRRTFIFSSAAMLVGSLTGCDIYMDASITRKLYQSLDDYQHIEEINRVIFSADGKQLVFIGPKHHYIFDAPESLKTLVNSPLHGSLTAKIDDFVIDPNDASITTSIRFYTENIDENDKKLTDEATALGLSNEYKNLWDCKFTLHGARYSAKNFDMPASADALFPKKEILIVVAEKRSMVSKVAIIAPFSPLTVAADGVIFLGITVFLRLPFPFMPFISLLAENSTSCNNSKERPMITRRTFILSSAAMLTGSMTGCEYYGNMYQNLYRNVSLTNKLYQTTDREYVMHRVEHTERIDQVLFSADGKKLVFIGPTHHYIFDAPKDLKALVTPPLRKNLAAELSTFMMDASNTNVTACIRLFIKNSNENDKKSSTPLDQTSWRDYCDSTLDNCTFILHGTLYSAGNFNIPASASAIFPKTPLRINISIYEAEAMPPGKKVARILLTPLTVAADGIIFLGATLLFPFVLPFGILGPIGASG